MARFANGAARIRLLAVQHLQSGGTISAQSTTAHREQAHEVRSHTLSLLRPLFQYQKFYPDPHQQIPSKSSKDSCRVKQFGEHLIVDIILDILRGKMHIFTGVFNSALTYLTASNKIQRTPLLS